MLGYHYTSWENWERIQEEGMHPQWIIEDSVREASLDSTGIWFYLCALEGPELLGMLLSILGSKRCFRVCELETIYQKHIQARNDDDFLRIRYTASIGNWDFVKSVPVGITNQHIPLTQINLTRVWSLDQINEYMPYKNRFACSPRNGKHCNLGDKNVDTQRKEALLPC